VTQVVSPSEGHVFHNRLTHTLEVAQVGRRLAEKLVARHSDRELSRVGGIDPEVVEAACLAHDLGHPPFGHVAEVELQECIDRERLPADGFEGNAQSLRIVTKLAVHRAADPVSARDYRGLNLSRATLNATLKYPWFRDSAGSPKQKFGVYESERPDFEWARRGRFAAADGRSVEADLMDWADDVAYSVHDVEDFFRAGIIPLDRLARGDRTETEKFLARVEKRHSLRASKDGYAFASLRDAFADLMRFMSMALGIDEPYNGSRSHRGRLRTLTSTMIGLYINALTLRATRNVRGSFVDKDPMLAMQVAMLKSLTWEYVVDDPRLATQQHGQRTVIRRLFEIYTEAAGHERTWNLFPPLYREELVRISDGADGADERARLVVDLIASMTERQAGHMFERLTGSSSGSVLDRI
jgi:dGTPase